MSIVQRIQKISQNIPDNVELLWGEVIEIEPLKIQILSNSKRTPSGDSLIIPQRLSKYDVLHNSILVTIDNSLKLQDIVICMYYDVWELYYIMDKVVT